MNDLDARIGKLTEEFFDKIQELKEELKQENKTDENKFEFFDVEELKRQIENPVFASDVSIFDGIARAFVNLSLEDEKLFEELFSEVNISHKFVITYFIELGIRYERERGRQKELREIRDGLTKETLV